MQVTSRTTALVLLAASFCGALPARELRFCADANNLPFSNSQRQGFDNRIADLVARDLGATATYTWWSARRGYVRITLYAHRCDVLIGIPVGMPQVLSTKPYYRSAYVFAYRKDSGFQIATLQDPVLRKIRIGVQIVAENYAPPADVLAMQGIIDNLVGYNLLGEEGEAEPAAVIIDAVGRGDVDAAIVWGPFAGYFARRQPKPVEIVAIPRSPLLPAIPFAFDICLGVRTGDERLRDEINGVLERRRADIEKILDDYGVPRVAP
jgi:quinoprotein dehydrogenase-associated probable ABC transporter substrate-binding protein